MAISTTNIATAIRELLDGTVGAVRKVTASTVMTGHTPWDAQILVLPRYDVTFGKLANHPSTPVSALSSFRIANLEVTIEVYHTLRSAVKIDVRNTIREAVTAFGDVAMQALGYPGNLNLTSTSQPTGIVSGMLTEMDHSIMSEDWDDRPPRITSRITGTAIVRISQSIS
jgi:hypothetical protein